MAPTTSGGDPPAAELPLPTTATATTAKPRIIIVIEHDQHRALKIFGADHGLSMSVVVRALIETFLLRADWQREIKERVRPPGGD